MNRRHKTTNRYYNKNPRKETKRHSKGTEKTLQLKFFLAVEQQVRWCALRALGEKPILDYCPFPVGNDFPFSRRVC